MCLVMVTTIGTTSMAVFLLFLVLLHNKRLIFGEIGWLCGSWALFYYAETILLLRMEAGLFYFKMLTECF